MIKNFLRIILSRRALIIAILLLQILFLAFTFTGIGIFGNSSAKHILRAVQAVMVVITLLSVIGRREKSGYKILWIVLILMLPLFGCVLYYLFKFQTSVRRLNKRYKLIECHGSDMLCQDEGTMDKLSAAYPEGLISAKYLSGAAHFPIYENTFTEYYPLADTMYPRLIEELARAEKFIFIEYFIIDLGVMWDGVFNILKEKARAGVDVRIIYDDLGCMANLPKDFAASLAKEGIKAVNFNPFMPILTAIQNHRDHRKIVVIDGKTAFTGGANIADEYINKKERFGHWRDACMLISGDAVHSFTVFFLNMWSFITGKNEILPISQAPAGENTASDGFIQPYCDSPTDHENVAEHVYMQMITGAKDYLYICTPYLIVDDSMISALTLAAKSGVDVRIITPHIPDKKVVHATTRSYYEPLTRDGVRIYEYLPGFIHSKVFVSDDIHASVGSANLDYRSLYLHFECGVRLYGCSSITDIKQDFLSILDSCEEITHQKCYRNFVSKFYQSVMRLLAPFM